MFFEGSEKKAEIILNPKKVSLLTDYSDDFWASMVKQCNAQILSSTRNDQVTAYLLSESSLFVWQHRLLILTCGDTRLVDAIIFFLNQIDSELIEQVIYQRKNEYCAHLQASHILDDAKKLQRTIAGKLLRFGALDSHHSYLFHLENNFQGAPEDKTYEVLIYNIDESISDRLTEQKQSNMDMRELLRLNAIIADFTIDDHVFEPFGYSLNAIRGGDYLTIHLTPQKQNSYVSFESNMNLIEFLPIILEIFSPTSFDLLCYNETEFNQQIRSILPSSYIAKELVEDQLSCGYLLNFATYYKQQTQIKQPTNINLQDDYHVF